MAEINVDRLPPVESAWRLSGREAETHRGRERAAPRKPPPEPDAGDEPGDEGKDEGKAGFDGFA